MSALQALIAVFLDGQYAWLKSFLAGEDALIEDRRHPQEKYYKAKDLWYAVEMGAQIHLETGTNPINNIVRDFIIDDGRFLKISRAKMDELEDYLLAKYGVKIKPTVKGTRGVYNCHFGFRSDGARGFLISKESMSRDLLRGKRNLLEMIDDKDFRERFLGQRLKLVS